MRWFWQKPVPYEAPDIGYAHPDHEAFNEALEQRRSPAHPSVDINAPWMKPDALLRLPDVGGAFEKSSGRDASISAQDRHASLSQSRGESSGSGSVTKASDAPKPALRPKGDLRKRSDHAAREDKWFAELRDAVMKAAVLPTEPTTSPPTHKRMEVSMK